MNKSVIIVLLVIILSVFSFLLIRNMGGKTLVPADGTKVNNGENTTDTNKKTGMANPASVYCEEQGGTVSIRKDASGGEYGVCVFDDGSECDEWKYFRKECTKGTPVDSPVVDEKADLELIKLALVGKDGIDLDEVIVTISKREGNYVSGGIRPKEEGVGGAYFFAAKTESGWNIVASGNGVIFCEDVAPYPDFPSDMIPECYDAATENSVAR